MDEQHRQLKYKMAGCWPSVFGDRDILVNKGYIIWPTLAFTRAFFYRMNLRNKLVLINLTLLFSLPSRFAAQLSAVCTCCDSFAETTTARNSQFIFRRSYPSGQLRRDRLMKYAYFASFSLYLRSLKTLSFF